MNSRGARIFVIAVAVVLVIVAITIFPHFVSSGSGGTDGPQLATVAFRSFPVTATANGTVVPASEVEVNFVNPGQLTQIAVQVGQAVTAGTVLARIDPSVAESDLAAAEAGLAQARVAPILGTDFADGQAQINAAAAEVQRAQDELAETTLVAPSAGTVLEVNGQVGEIVSGAATAAATLPGSSAEIPVVTGTGASTGTGTTAPQNAFIVIGDPTSVVVGAAFSSMAAMSLVAGQSGTITADTVSGLSAPCHLLAVAADPTLVNGTYMFWATVVPNSPTRQLRSGMAVDVSISVSQAKNVLAVDQSAVYVLDGVPHVDVWKGRHPVSTVVGTGLQGTELVQITAGLNAGEQVVLSAFQGVP